MAVDAILTPVFSAPRSRDEVKYQSTTGIEVVRIHLKFNSSDWYPKMSLRLNLARAVSLNYDKVTALSAAKVCEHCQVALWGFK